MTGHSRLRPLLSAAVVLAPLCAGTAQAQERGEFMRDALSGIGLLEKRQDPIDYHERPPLVMPPKIDGKALPQPRARSTSTAWPKDPEIVERERAAEVADEMLLERRERCVERRSASVDWIGPAKGQ